MMKFRIWLPVILVSGLLFSCHSAGHEGGKESLMKADVAFSELSKAKGMKQAFIEFADTGVVLLRENHYPLVGIQALRKQFESFSDTGFILTWNPLFADIAGSGELGYTYGIYFSEIADSAGHPVVSKGTYVTIWKKDESGKWKFVLDTGNEGLGKQP